MKRALAERAKQSGISNGIGSSSKLAPSSRGDQTTSAPTPHQPLQTSHVHKLPEPVPSSGNSNGVSTPPLVPNRAISSRQSSTKSRGTKRQRESSNSSSVASLGSEDEDDTDRSAFYLRQQNRALGAELRQIKYQLQQLQKEREYRRNQCFQACQSINSLQATWTRMESTLLMQPVNARPSDVSASTREENGRNDTLLHSNAPASTGNGASVELVEALLSSIADMGKPSQTAANSNTDDDTDSDSDQLGSPSPLSKNLSSEAKIQELDDMLRITENISQRASLLQRWIWNLLQNSSSTVSASHAKRSLLESNELSRLSSQVSRLKAKCKRRKLQIEEMARTRDALEESDRRVRRGLYRLASHRMPLKEVLKDIERTDNDKQLAAKWMTEETTRSMLSESSSRSTTADAGADAVSPDGVSSANGVNASSMSSVVEKKLTNLEEVAKTRQEAIDKLLEEKKEREMKLNQLTLRAAQSDKVKLDDDDKERIVQESDLFSKQSIELGAAKKEVDEMKQTIDRLRTMCSEVMANEELASRSLAELREKHEKKWLELAGTYKPASSSDDMDVDQATDSQQQQQQQDPLSSPQPVTDDTHHENLRLAERVVRLEHKLTQAIENVRQAETTRQLLTEAVSMNELLQSKVDELKAKYSAVQQAAKESKSSGSGNKETSSSGAAAETGASTSKHRQSSSSISSSNLPPAEKLYKDNKKLQRDLEKYKAARESLKAKFERVEKERESLFQTNAKLLKQTAEKDEMNAKSLSTILHLKQITEKMSQEKEALEQQAKTANQVALAARLADNARERVVEEYYKARNEMAAVVSQWEEKCMLITAEKNELETRLAKNQNLSSKHTEDLAVSRKRCDELVSEVTKMEKEKHEMTELLAIAQKEAAEAKRSAQSLDESGSDGRSSSGFTAEQLSTQVSVLKGRLACPVCNHRDKKCILLRCRHMFCRECVDINIKNRSRKCPACGIRFDTKDVADIWL